MCYQFHPQSPSKMDQIRKSPFLRDFFFKELVKTSLVLEPNVEKLGEIFGASFSFPKTLGFKTGLTHGNCHPESQVGGHASLAWPPILACMIS